MESTDKQLLYTNRTASNQSVLAGHLDEKDFSERAEPAYWRALERNYQGRLYVDILFELTRMEFDNYEARNHWLEILKHRKRLCRALCRQVGLRTTMCDYFTSLRPVFDRPVVVESLLLARSEQHAVIDELTGLNNRRFFNRELSRELERARRSGEPVSLLMVDVDHFKDYNDSFGHLAGDARLRRLADILRCSARLSDHVSRYGGEEFTMILPRTNKEEALFAAERYRLAVAWADFEHNQLTISVGVATFPDDADKEAGLVAAADRAMYRAKQLGRNRVCQSGMDQRSVPRFPLTIPAECRYGADAVPGATVNISTAGMLFASRRPVAEGERVRTLLQRPGLDGKALPVWANPVGRRSIPGDVEIFYTGMRFESQPQTTRRLERFIMQASAVLH